MGTTFKSKKIPPGKVLEFTLFGNDAKIRESTPEEKRFDNVLNEIGDLTNDNEWWFDRRLEREVIYDFLKGRLKPEQIDLYLDSFKSIYDNDWWRPRSLVPEAIVRRDPLSFFCVQSTIEFIVRIGECLDILGGKEVLDSELIDRLQNRETFKSAVFELESAACFKQADFVVTMYPTVPSGCKPEGRLLKDGKEIYYEVTERHFSGHQLKSNKIESHILNWINNNIGLVDGFIEFLIKKDNMQELVNELIDFLDKQLKKGLFNQFPYHFKNDKFEIYICKHTLNGSWFGVNGLEPDQEYIIEQWMKKLFKKAKQLPSGKCGVIIGSPLFLWGPDELNAAINAISRELKLSTHSRVSGIILCAKHIERSGIIRHIPSIIFNPRAEIKNEDKIKAMATALFTYPDW